MRSSVLAAAILLALITWHAAIAPAIAAEALEAPKLRLETLTEDLKLSEERVRLLRSEVEALRSDRAALNQRLIETAQRVQDSEAQIASAEDRLNQLNSHERLLRASLRARRGILVELLAALQRLGRKPPPALAVRPEDALAAVRSAILLGTVVPEIRQEANKLAADLGQLIELRNRIAEQKNLLAEQTLALAEERARIEVLIESKRTTLAQTEEQLQESRRQAEELASKTQSLRDLIAQMDRRFGGDAKDQGAEPAVSAEQRRLALNNPGRIEPAIPFAQARGALPRPVRGVTLSRFGDPDGFGGTAKGLSIATRRGAQVISPGDGWVVYSGPFRSYGQLLIINGGRGYHMVLAGLESVTVEMGQFVLAGEPVGTMGQDAVTAQTVSTSASDERPILYVEFRKDGSSIDPDPWWASNEEKVRG